mgnify:CR=1 FL=1
MGKVIKKGLTVTKVLVWNRIDNEQEIGRAHV